MINVEGFYISYLIGAIIAVALGFIAAFGEVSKK